MCGHKRNYDMGYEQSGYYQSRKLWHISWLPFVVILFLAFNFHSWSFMLQPWMFWWLLWMVFPVIGVISSSLSAKTRGSLMFSAKPQTQQIPQQTYEQPYQNTRHYTEGGQNFQYPQQQQVQQMQYEEPYSDYQ